MIGSRFDLLVSISFEAFRGRAKGSRRRKPLERQVERTGEVALRASPNSDCIMVKRRLSGEIDGGPCLAPGWHVFCSVALGEAKHRKRVPLWDTRSASRTVKFADLNLSNPRDAHVLYMRILAAAQVVCSYHWFATDADKARCVHEAIADG